MVRARARYCRSASAAEVLATAVIRAVAVVELMVRRVDWVADALPRNSSSSARICGVGRAAFSAAIWPSTVRFFASQSEISIRVCGVGFIAPSASSLATMAARSRSSSDGSSPAFGVGVCASRLASRAITVAILDWASASSAFKPASARIWSKAVRFPRLATSFWARSVSSPRISAMARVASSSASTPE